MQFELGIAACYNFICGALVAFFAKILTGRPLFTEKKSMTDIFVTPLTDTIFANMMLLFMKNISMFIYAKREIKEVPFLENFHAHSSVLKLFAFSVCIAVICVTFST